MRPDGTELTARVLHAAPDHLRTGGKIYSPLISLADTRKLHGIIGQMSGYEFVAHDTYHVPFPPRLNCAMDLLGEFKDRSVIDFNRRGSRHTWRLDICSLSASDARSPY